MDLYKKFSSDLIKRTELIRSLQSLDKTRRDIRKKQTQVQGSESGSESELESESNSDMIKRTKTSTSVTDSNQARLLAQRSAETRRYRASKMDDLLAGRARIRDFLEDMKMIDMKLLQVVMAFPRMTREKALLLLTEAGINPKRRLRGLKTEQFNDLGFVLQNKYPAYTMYL